MSLRSSIFILSVSCHLFFGSSILCAQADRFGEIASRLESASKSFVASDIPNPDESKSELITAINGLEEFIDLDSPNGQRWNRFLGLSELKEALARPAVAPSFLYGLHANMRQNYEGLEYPQFVKVREGIDNLASAMRFGRNPDGAIKFLKSEVDKAVLLLRSPDSDSWTKEIALFDLYGILEQARQLGDSWQVINEGFRKPNLHFHLTEEMVNRLALRPVQEPNDVNECILGTRIRGKACLTGTVSFDFLPHYSGANVDINMVGNLTSNNRGYNRGVILKTTGRSPINARKLITVTPEAISAGETRVAAALSTQINAIQHRSRLVRRIAKRKAAEQKSLADSIALGRLKKKLALQYDAQVFEQIGQLQNQYVSFQKEAATRPEYARLEFPVPSVDFHSTDHSIEANLTHAVHYHLAASGACPLPRLSDGGAIEIHQSVINNALDRLLGGRRIKSEKLDNFALQITKEVPPEVQKQADGPKWEAALNRYFPIVVSLDNGQLVAEFRLLELTGQDLRLRGMKVKVTYDVSFRDEKLILDRVGDIEITGGTTVQRGALRGKLKPSFEEHIETEPLLVTSLLPQAKPQVRDILSRVTVQDVRIDDGWMQIIVR